jgi:hypothetical protein
MKMVVKNEWVHPADLVAVPGTVAAVEILNPA